MFSILPTGEDIFVCLECGKVSTCTNGKEWALHDNKYLYNKLREFKVTSIKLEEKEYVDLSEPQICWQEYFHFGVLCGDCAQKYYDEWNEKISDFYRQTSDINSEYLKKTKEHATTEIKALIDQYISLLNVDDINYIGQIKQNPYVIDSLDEFDAEKFLKMLGPRLAKNAKSYMKAHWDNTELDLKYESQIGEISKQLKELSKKALYAMPQHFCFVNRNYFFSGIICEFENLSESVNFNRIKVEKDKFDHSKFYWIIPLDFLDGDKSSDFKHDLNLSLLPDIYVSYYSRINDYIFIHLNSPRYYRNEVLEKLTSRKYCYLITKFNERFKKGDGNL